MKVLWTSNLPLPRFADAIGLSVGWGGSRMAALADELPRRCSRIELGVLTMFPARAATTRVIDDVSYFLVPCSSKDMLRRPGKHVFRAFEKVLADFAPDVIHVHGSEYSHGLVASEIAPHTPIVMEIQELIGEYQKYYWSGMSFRDLICSRTIRDWIRFDGLLEQRWKWRRRARMEAEILRRTRHVIGRTDWDRAHAKEINPDAAYHHCDEMLREQFHSAVWRAAAAKRHTIFTSSSLYPIKGFHVLLEAVRLLKPFFPDVEVRVAGSNFGRAGDRAPLRRCLHESGYSRCIRDRISAYGLTHNVGPLGALEAEAMAEELAGAHVYVLPSFIENSPNSLAEAMLVGTPSIAPYTGGVPSLAADESEALFHPPGDAAVLAERVRQIFEDDALAETLSRNARRRAHARHAPETIIADLSAVYEKTSGFSTSARTVEMTPSGVFDRPAAA